MQKYWRKWIWQYKNGDNPSKSDRDRLMMEQNIDRRMEEGMQHKQ
jgi:hypothetical protein